MKRPLMDFVLCPECLGELTLHVLQTEKEEIMEGELACDPCQRKFPITRGIPRLVAGGLTQVEKATAERFGYEWKEFGTLSDKYERQFLDWIDPISPSFFKEKVVLDGGCGKGRHSFLAGKFGAKTVVGVDLSDAVESAFANTRHLSNVHILQADIYHLPLKSCFDYVYSIGVLHHLPDPKKAFNEFVAKLKMDGAISVWVYGFEGNRWIIYGLNPFRRFFTSKLPLPLLKSFSFFLSGVLYFLLKGLYRPMGRFFPVFSKFLFYQDYLMYISKFDFREIYSIVFDHLLAPIAFYLKKEEVEAWFRHAGLVSVNVSWHNRNSWRGFGQKKERVEDFNH